MSLDDVSGSLILKSKDSTTIKVERKHALISTMVTKALENDENAEELEIDFVSGDVLIKVAEYMTHHAGVDPEPPQKPLRSKKMAEVCKDAWDATFIDEVMAVSKEHLYAIVLAANYMDIPSLLNLGCAKIASLIKGQPLDKIKDILNPDVEEAKTEA